jgi:hypothetical protein
VNIDDIVRHITANCDDDDLDVIEGAISARKDILVTMTRATLRTGTAVIIAGDLRPKYLQGLAGKVVKISKTRADVEITNGQEMRALHPRYFRHDGVLPGVPISCLKVL